MSEIEYKDTLPDPTQYFALFESTGWNAVYQVSMGDLQEALHRSWKIVAAYSGDVLVGFGRVVSDGILYGTIYDLIVAPRYQGRGIGTELLARLVRECQLAGLRSIQLFSAKGKVAFYEKCGFVPRKDDAPGMFYCDNRIAGN